MTKLKLLQAIEVMTRYDEGFEIEECDRSEDIKWYNSYNPTWNWEAKDYMVKNMRPIINEAIEKGAEIEYKSPGSTTWRTFNPSSMEIYANILYRIKDDSYSFSTWNKYSEVIEAWKEGKRVQQRIGENWIDVDYIKDGYEYRILENAIEPSESFENKLERIKNALDEVETPKVETITVEKDFLDKILDKLEICCENKERL